LTLFGGRTLALEALRGKVVMIDFWASWCPPCRQEAPVLAQVYEEYKGKGVEFVGVDIWDSRSEALKFIDRYGVTYPSGLDGKGIIAIDYGVSGIPEKYFIDRNGLLVKKFIGPMDEAKLKQVLDEMLNERSSPGG
jgi:cytochrome c biogenesis protein CcmG/thiol:disulfide interchange protein DsbE